MKIPTNGSKVSFRKLKGMIIKPVVNPEDRDPYCQQR